MRRAFAGVVVASFLALPVSAAELGRGDWRQQREAIEAFLLAAEVVEEEDIPIGVTKPKRLTLEHAGERARASWKTYEMVAPRVLYPDGRSEINFRDSYRHELAAYELDQMLGLDLVPPTVFRKIGKKKGALRIWVEDSMTEAERLRSRIEVPDPEAWIRQMSTVRLFYALIYNSDYKNVSNLVVDADFRISTIDLSRGFGVKKELLGELRLSRVARPVLERLVVLDKDSIEGRLGRWLTKLQVRTLLKRRDLLLARFEALIETKGEDAVVFDPAV